MLEPFPAVSFCFQQAINKPTKKNPRFSTSTTIICFLLVSLWAPLQPPLHSRPHLSKQSRLNPTRRGDGFLLPLLSSASRTDAAPSQQQQKTRFSTAAHCLSLHLACQSIVLLPQSSRALPPKTMRSQTSPKGLPRTDWAPLTDSRNKKWDTFQCQRGLDLPQRN